MGKEKDSNPLFSPKARRMEETLIGVSSSEGSMSMDNSLNVVLVVMPCTGREIASAQHGMP